MSLKASPSHATGGGPAPGPGRGWWLRRLVPLVLVSVLGSLGYTATAGVVVRQAADKVRHAAVDTGETSAEVEAQRQAAVDGALRGMNQALTEGKIEDFVKVVDPGDPGLRDRQAATFRALERLPGAQVRYGWTGREWARPAGLAARYGDPESIVAVVQRRYWLKGWDRAPAAELVALTFARRDGRWVLAGDGDGKGVLPPTVMPEPWSVGDVTVVTTARVMVIGDRAGGAAGEEKLRRLARRVEDAVTGVRQLWDHQSWNGKVVVYAVATDSFTGPWFGNRASDGRATGTGDAAEFDAEVVPVSATTMDGGKATEKLAGMRMVVAPTVLEYDDNQARSVIRHELTHLATLGIGGQAPAWVTEGVAEYTAYRAGGGSVDGVAALDRRGLPKPMWAELRRSSYRPQLVTGHDAFYAGTGLEVSERYTDGWLAVLYIADTRGEDALRRFTARAADPALPDPDAREKAALQEVLGTDRATFARSVSRYARDLRRHFV